MIEEINIEEIEKYLVWEKNKIKLINLFLKQILNEFLYLKTWSTKK
jgi:hypothetical protein